MKTANFISSFVLVLYLALLGAGSASHPSRQLHCNGRFRFCLDYPDSLFASAYFSPGEDSIVLLTADSIGELTVIGTETLTKQDSYLAFEQRLKELTAPGGLPNILSIINGDDYYEVSFLYGGHWYHQKAGFFQNHDVLFTIRVPVSRPDLMVGIREGVGIEF